MSSGTIEVIPVEELEELLGTSPRCDVYVWEVDKGALCGRPAAVRISVTCTRCGGPKYGFACPECLQQIRAGLGQCTACSRTDISWAQC